MRRFVFSLTAAFLAAACLIAAHSPVTQAPASQAPRQTTATLKSQLFDAQQLLKDLEILSADDMQGRQVATPGGEKARAYVVERFKASGLQPVGAAFEHPFTFSSGRGDQAAERTGVNVVGKIEGRNTTRYIVITAHYDHVGVR